MQRRQRTGRNEKGKSGKPPHKYQVERKQPNDGKHLHERKLVAGKRVVLIIDRQALKNSSNFQCTNYEDGHCDHQHKEGGEVTNRCVFQPSIPIARRTKNTQRIGLQPSHEVWAVRGQIGDL